ncbi:VOC family protein [Streptomyces lushanensis]|uniref:VOC family protein n=1 Tax=Streptomyces lushanensis TaxID=1434255 RepID=UPI000832E4A6|nr:VOC family protein [Streptomyces lushanensis]
MLTSPYAPGSPIRVELSTPDIEAATAFYNGLFGWTFVPAGPDTGGYGLLRLGGRTAAAAMPMPTDEGPTAWFLFFRTADADATAKAVHRAGGSVLLGPTDVMEFGRTAVLTDSVGARFAVWQPGANKGLDVVDEPGGLCWCELYTPDEGAAYTFYHEVFGWETTSMPMPDGSGTYRMAHPAGRGPEAMFGGFVTLGSDPAEAGGGPHWQIYFAVTDCDASVSAARKLGGTVRVAPTDIEGVGRFAKLTDPHGARFALMQGVDQDV